MKRPFCVIGGAFVASALTASFLGVTAQVVLLIACMLLFLFSVFYLDRRRRAFAACLFFFAGLAMGAFALKTTFVDRAVQTLDAAVMEITGTVTDIRERDNHRYSYYLTVDAAHSPNGRPFRTILYSDRYLEADYYDRLTAEVEFYLPRDSETFGAVRYYRSQDIHILASLGEGSASVRPPESRSWLYHVLSLNDRLCRSVDETLPAREAGTLKSMILGNRHGVDFTLRERYANAGTVHLFAISGIHVAILAGFLEVLFRFLKGRKRLPTVLQMLVICGFIVLSGMSLSAVRAGVMCLLILAGRLFSRKPESCNSLCFAGFAITAVNVYSVMDTGFLMSFSATLGIILFARRLSDYLMSKTKAFARLQVWTIRTVSVSLVANLFLLPVYLLHFGVLSLVFLPANLVTNLTGTASIVLGFLYVFLLAPPLPAVLLLPLRLAVQGVLWIQNTIVGFFGGLPFATLGLDDKLMLLGFALSAVILGGAYLSRKKYRMTGPAALLCLALLFSVKTVSALAQHQYTKIAVIGDGRTSNIVITSDFRATVISPYDNGYIDERTYRYLKRNDIRRIDNLILMYPDFKQYQDTLRLVENIPTGSILYNTDNTACVPVLREKSEALAAIGSGGQITVGDDYTIKIGYYKTIMNIELECRGVTLGLTNHIPTLQDWQPDISVLRGTVSGALTGIDSDHVILTQKQWSRVLSDTNYQNASAESVEFIITRDGTLKQIQ